MKLTPVVALLAAVGLLVAAVVGGFLYSPSSVRLSVEYDNGRLTADIHNAPLDDVLQELATKTGTRFSLYDPMLASTRISASVKQMPLIQGIKKILTDFSYGIIPIPGKDLSRVAIFPTDKMRSATSLFRGAATENGEEFTPTVVYEYQGPE